jgi:signal transduction histidine kinase
MSIDENVDRLAFELHPRELDDLGLEDTLRRHVQQWSAASGIAVSTHFRGLDHDHLSTFVETTIYRIIQEAMTNILRHAGATRVSLIVERRGTEILAIIEDDGRGFDVEAMQGERRRLGLQGMTERAALANGKLDIESEPGSGTTVYLHVPIPSESEEGV